MDRVTTTRALTIVALLTVVLYAPLGWAPFVWQDTATLTGSEFLHWDLPGRGLALWTWHVIGWHPGAAHLVNLGLHLCNGFLLYVVVRRLATIETAVLAAGLFWLHPLNSESVAYLTGRADLLVTLWTLVAVWSAVTWIDTQGGWRVLLCGVAILLSGLSKEIGLIALPLVLTTALVLRPRHQATNMVLQGLLGLGGVVIGATYWHLAGWVGISPAGGGTALPWSQFALFQLATLWDRLLRMVYPVGFVVDPDALALSVGWQLVSVLLTLHAAVIAVWAWRRAPLVAWGIVWVGLCVAPRFVFGSAEFLKEYQLSTAMVGLSVLGGAALSSLLARRPVLVEQI